MLGALDLNLCKACCRYVCQRMQTTDKLLQYKTFQFGDVIANLLGASIGLYAATFTEKCYQELRQLELAYAPIDVENPDNAREFQRNFSGETQFQIDD